MFEPQYVYIFYAAFSGYALFLLVAAVNDTARFIIPNFVSIGLVVLFLITALLLPFKTNWLSHLGVAFLVFSVGLFFYKFKILGAGDVKLITALSVWAGWERLDFLLLYIVIAGGVLAVGLAALRLVLFATLIHAPAGLITAVPRLLQTGQHIPYGVAIASGGLYLAFELPHLLGYL